MVEELPLAGLSFGAVHRHACRLCGGGDGCRVGHLDDDADARGGRAAGVGRRPSARRREQSPRLSRTRAGQAARQRLVMGRLRPRQGGEDRQPVIRHLPRGKDAAAYLVVHMHRPGGGGGTVAAGHAHPLRPARGGGWGRAACGDVRAAADSRPHVPCASRGHRPRLGARCPATTRPLRSRRERLRGSPSSSTAPAGPAPQKDGGSTPPPPPPQ